MIVEFLCRYSEVVDENYLVGIEEELDTQEIIKGNKFNREKEKQKLLKGKKAFEYGPVMFDLDDVETANSVDEEHTAIKFYSGVMRIIKFNYEEYKAVYQTMTSKLISSFLEEPKIV